ncbi:pyridoxal phosphate-dependent transferase [Dactylonectria estremocensis]|uniref:Pyridoxal phosphate-dependent transferase n=1 Tax=Dactylonectria estremocensis TaxID=1079267 RepID=A0A9P9FD51_9HYPO|nr:pyridoxal phosphate-dependent transferase [Dactylonectria estremocensis]
MHLSTRAQQVSNASENAVIWQVMSNLWDPKDNPDGYISLGIAENKLMHDELSKHIHDNFSLSHKAFAYSDSPSGSKQLKKAISDFLNRYLKPVRPLEPGHVSVTNGCSSAIEHLSWALANEGEAFLLGRPYYGTLDSDLTLRFGNKLVPASFHNVDPLSENAIDAYERALVDIQADGRKVSAIIVSHPHNPLGRCYPRQVLIGLMKLCEKYQLHFISDEIYALSVWENSIDHPAPVRFDSVLSIDTAGVIDPSRVHVVWGIAKDFGANGIRVGAVLSQSNPTLHNALVPAGVYSQVSSLSEHVTINMLQDSAWVDSFIETNRKRLSETYGFVVEWARRHDIEYAQGTNAALFVWANLGQFYRRRHFLAKTADVADVVEQRLLDRRVFVASGKDFGAENTDWFRIVFGQDGVYLGKGLDRIIAALG